MDIPERLTVLRGLVVDAKRDGIVTLNAKVWEGQNMVDAYNALAEQRDELAECLRVILDKDAFSDQAIAEARAALAKVST